MKTPLFALLVFSLALPSFAQTTENVDPNAINQHVKEERAKRRAERREAAREFFKDLAEASKELVQEAAPDHLGNPLGGPRKKLSSIESAQADVLACAEKMVLKGTGGTSLSKLLDDVLLPVSTNNGLINDLAALKAAKARCKADRKSVDKRAMEDFEVWAAIDMTKLPSKIKTVLTSFESPSFECQVRKVSASAGVGIAFGAGAVDVKCLGTNGKIRHYVGAEAGFGLGFGVMVGFQVLDVEALEFYESKMGVAYSSGAFEDADFDYAIVMGTNPDGVLLNEYDVQNRGAKPEYTQTQTNLNLGMGAIGRVSKGFGIRVMNGIRRWDTVLAYLNK